MGMLLKIKAFIRNAAGKSSGADEKRFFLRKLKMFTIIFVLGFCTGIFVFLKRPLTGEKAGSAVLISTDEKAAGENYILTIEHVQDMVKPAGDLIVTKYYYTDAGVYENYKELFGKRVPFTTDQVVFTYDGKISIGMELSEITFDIDNAGKVISVVLPDIGIMSNEVDASSFSYPYVSNSVFNLTEMEDYTGLIARLKQKKEREVAENTELMNDALRNAKKVLENLLTASDATKEYRIVFQ